MELKIRTAVSGDSRPVWEINRHPSVRQAAFSTEDITWESHQAWFEKVLQDPARVLLVGCIENDLVAVVRFDRVTPALSEITIAVKADIHGKGVGRRMIAGASKLYLASQKKVLAIRAYVKEDNLASQRAFECAGYRLGGADRVRGVSVLCYFIRGFGSKS